MGISGISWDLYQALWAARGDGAAPRMDYCEGVLTIMVPGRPHERAKTRLARLLEAYCDELGIGGRQLGRRGRGVQRGFLEARRLTIWALALRGADQGEYLRVERSVALPDLVRCMDVESQPGAVAMLRAALRMR
jgi:hypothetical protein